MTDSKLVYSTDPKLQKRCPKCKELTANCSCAKATGKAPPKFIAILRVEKSGRKGKEVTVIDNLPKVELYLKEWTKELKNKCGSGGTYRMDGKEGRIEIQGDKREQVRAILEAKNIRVKG